MRALPAVAIARFLRVGDWSPRETGVGSTWSPQELKFGAEGGIRTPTPYGATPSRWCVCQFRHFRKRDERTLSTVAIDRLLLKLFHAG